MVEQCKVDTSRTDTYEGNIVPDADVEICLKVIRSVRNAALTNESFDADASVLLSHTHAAIVSWIDNYKRQYEQELNL